MMKVILVLFILALTTDATVLASTARYSPLRHSVSAIFLKSHILAIVMPHLMRNPVSPSIQSVLLKIRGRGTQAGLGPGSYDYSVVPVQTRVQKIKSVHSARKLLTPDDVMTIARPTSKAFSSIRAVSIQIFKPSSNNLSDIFIPPRTSL